MFLVWGKSSIEITHKKTATCHKGLQLSLLNTHTHTYICKGTFCQQILQQTLQISYKTYHSHLLKCLLHNDFYTKLNCI